MFRGTLFGLVATLFALPAMAVELVMVEQHGCFYCELWNDQIAPIYPKTAEGKAAPLRRVDLHEKQPADLKFKGEVHFTPTFILIEDGQELDRFEGYPGEDFFWWVLSEMMRKNIGFDGQS
jgi:thioredoxin-related protein